MDTDILIVGGGLAGLSIAAGLKAGGADCLLVEAADRLGGRILTRTIGGAAFDLGPAWFWPDQPRMAALVARLGVQQFDQYSDGASIFQDQSGAVQRGHGFASMQGSYRVAGGMGALIDGLQGQLPDQTVQLNTTVTSLTKTQTGVTAQVQTRAGPATIAARKVVLAIPPRVVAGTIAMSPALPDAAVQTMQGIATWMAGQAKIIAVYDRPYWRDAGLSGDGTSYKGPMVEIHDASPAKDGPSGLFGFVGIPPLVRQQHAETIVELARDQLVAMFGEKLANPIEIRLQDWAHDPLIATPDDHVPMRTHPTYGMPPAISTLWDGDLILGSTETGHQFGGFLEGALEAGETTVARLGTGILGSG
jgi:monoamine oxidase